MFIFILIYDFLFANGDLRAIPKPGRKHNKKNSPSNATMTRNGIQCRSVVKSKDISSET
jgi:hypothetical protein